MNKILITVFDSEAKAYEGLSALKELHRNGDITLYATAILSKDSLGEVSVKQTADEGSIGTAVGMLTGSLVGLLGGPVGMVLGSSVGGLIGAIGDLNKSGVDIEFIEDVAKVLSPGKTAVLADVNEDWMTPVDTQLGHLGGAVFRRLRSEVVEDQMAREAAVFNTEVDHLKEEVAQAKTENKAAIQKQLDDTKKKLQGMLDSVNAQAEQLKSETDAKIATMEKQRQEAKKRKKAKIEKRIAEVKTDFEARNAKLEQAGQLIKEALTSESNP